MKKENSTRQQATNKSNEIAKYVFDKKTQYNKRLKSFAYFSAPIWIVIIVLMFCAFFINGHIVFLGLNIFFVLEISISIAWLIIFFIVAVTLKNISKNEFKPEELEKNEETSK